MQTNFNGCCSQTQVLKKLSVTNMTNKDSVSNVFRMLPKLARHSIEVSWVFVMTWIYQDFKEQDVNNTTRNCTGVNREKRKERLHLYLKTRGETNLKENLSY